MADNLFRNSDGLLRSLRGMAITEESAAKRAFTIPVRRATTTVKNAIRRQIKNAGLGDRLGKTIRGETFPARGFSVRIAGRISSRAIVHRAGGTHDLILAFAEGREIAPVQGKYLFVKSKDVKQIGRKRAQPSDFPPNTFNFIPLNKGNTVGVLVFRDTGTLAFTAIRRTTLRKRLDPFTPYERAIARLPQQILTAWEREAAKAGVRL